MNIDSYENRLAEVAKLCSDISTCNSLDNFLLKDSTSEIFSKIFSKRIVVDIKDNKKYIPFTSLPQKVASYLFHIEGIYDLSDLDESRQVFNSISEIIEKRDSDFKDKFTGLPNAQGFIQSLVNSALNYNISRSSFIAFNFQSKDENLKIDERDIKKLVDEINYMKFLSNKDIFARWSQNIFCFLIIPDDKYERGISIQKSIRNHLKIYCKKNALNININMGIHRLPKGSIEFNEVKYIKESYRDSKINEILQQSNFRDFILKTFKAMAKAVDTTLIVGTSVYKDIKTKEFIPIRQIPTELMLKNIRK